MLESRNVSGDGLETIPRDQRNSFIGKLYARQTIYPGQLLQTDLLRTSPPLAVDQAQVGVPLTSGKYPPGLRSGDAVRLVRIGDSQNPSQALCTGLVHRGRQGQVLRLRQRRAGRGGHGRRTPGRGRPGRRRDRHRRARHRPDRPRRRASATPRSPTSPAAGADGPDRVRLGQGVSGRQRHRRRARPAVARPRRRGRPRPGRWRHRPALPQRERRPAEPVDRSALARRRRPLRPERRPRGPPADHGRWHAHPRRRQHARPGARSRPCLAAHRADAAPRQ